MRAVFTTAIRYKVNAVCETPLRTGGAAGNTESVLRDSFGNADSLLLKLYPHAFRY